MRDPSGEFALVERLRKREPDALETAYDRYSTLVYSLLLRITRNPSASEDLTQELFIRLWVQISRFDPAQGSLGNWILSIARNLGIDYMRSAHSRFTARLEPMDRAERSGQNRETEPETALDQERKVAAAFAVLNERQRQVLELAYFEGLSQTEIASRLHEPLGTVKSWMRSALQYLRSIASGEHVK